MSVTATQSVPISLLSPADLLREPKSVLVSGNYCWETQQRTEPGDRQLAATAQTSFSTATNNGWDAQTDLDQNM